MLLINSKSELIFDGQPLEPGSKGLNAILNQRVNHLVIANPEPNRIFLWYYGVVDYGGYIEIIDLDLFDVDLFKTAVGWFDFIEDGQFNSFSDLSLVVRRRPFLPFDDSMIDYREFLQFQGHDLTEFAVQIEPSSISAGLCCRCPSIEPRVVPAITFAIVTPTYFRSNGLSKSYVERALNSLAKQQYQNFHVFLIGDRYENESEFQEFSHLLPSSQLTMVNLDIAYERDFCKIKNNLWAVGGAYAMNYGIKLAQAKGLVHYVHLDDDDYFSHHHLANIAIGYLQHPTAEFVCTLGVNLQGQMLPRIGNYALNNYKAEGATCFHSSYGFRLDKIPYRYQTVDRNKEEVAMEPADKMLLSAIGAGGHPCLGINLLTCFHDLEAESLK